MKNPKGMAVTKSLERLVHKTEPVTSSASNVLGMTTLLLNAPQRKP